MKQTHLILDGDTTYDITKDKCTVTTTEEGITAFFCKWFIDSFESITGKRTATGYKTELVVCKKGTNNEWNFILLSGAYLTDMSNILTYTPENGVSFSANKPVKATIVYDYLRMIYDKGDISKYKSIIRKERLTDIMNNL